MLQFVEAAVLAWDSLHKTPVSKCFPRQSYIESSVAEESFLKPIEEASLQDLSIYSMLRGHSPIAKAPESTVGATLQDLFRSFLRSKLNILKTKSTVIPIKAQALTMALGSKSTWMKEFLGEHENDLEECSELFSGHRFNTEVLKAAAALA
jgi:hypothetical protein